MRRARPHTFDDNDLLVATGLREIGALARVTGLNTAGRLLQTRQLQLQRDRDRARQRNDIDRARALDAQADQARRTVLRLGEEREREAVVPTIFPQDQAMVRGRVTQAGRGVKGALLIARDTNGETLARTTSGPRGAFELPHPPVESLTLRIADAAGNHLLDRDVDGPGAGRACYLEIPLDGIEPMPPAPDDPPPDSRPRRVRVPVLRGMSEDEARATLEKTGLKAELGGTVPADDLVGLVVSQKPEPGRLVAPDSAVTFTLGRATGNGVMPRLVGETLRTAVGRLNALDLAPAATDFIIQPQNAGRVIAQSPEADTAIGPDTQVKLEVAIGRDRADLTTFSVLVGADPRGAELGLTRPLVRRRLTEGDVASLADLRKRMEQGDEALAELLQIDDRSQLRQARDLFEDILARLPWQG